MELSLSFSRLHEEIEDFYQWIMPTPEEHHMRMGVVRRIEECIQVRNGVHVWTGSGFRCWIVVGKVPYPLCITSYYCRKVPFRYLRYGTVEGYGTR